MAGDDFWGEMDLARSGVLLEGGTKGRSNMDEETATGGQHSDGRRYVPNQTRKEHPVT